MKDNPKGMIHQVEHPFHKKYKENNRKQHFKKDQVKGPIIDEKEYIHVDDKQYATGNVHKTIKSKTRIAPMIDGCHKKREEEQAT